MENPGNRGPDRAEKENFQGRNKSQGDSRPRGTESRLKPKGGGLRRQVGGGEPKGCVSYLLKGTKENSSRYKKTDQNKC